MPLFSLKFLVRILQAYHSSLVSPPVKSFIQIVEYFLWLFLDYLHYFRSVSGVMYLLNMLLNW